jgi:hypothetical protein
MQVTISIIVSLIIGFIIGIVVNNFPGIRYFSWEPNVNIVELVAIIFTGIVAIFITLKLERYVQDKRVEKELYVAKICEIENLFDEIDYLLKEQTPSYKKINSINSLLRIKKQSIFNNIQNFKQAKKICEGCDNYLSDHIRILKPLLTETSKDSGLVVKKDKCEYTMERIIEIQKEITSVKEKLFELKIKINAI